MIRRPDHRALGAARLAAVSVVAALCGCAATSGQPVRTFVRNCRNGVGYGGVTCYSQSRALHIGPLSLGALGTLPLASLDPTRPGQTRFGALEDIAVIKAGAVVTIEVPAVRALLRGADL
jgi:hypothetical protein